MKTVSMKPVVQKPRKDGFWAVYIRFTFDGRCHFWKTSKVVSLQNVKSDVTGDLVISVGPVPVGLFLPVFYLPAYSVGVLPYFCLKQREKYRESVYPHR